jgi:hypothetical protein
MRRSIGDAAHQAGVFAQVYADVLNPEQKELIDAFVMSTQVGFFRRNQIYVRYGLLKNGFTRMVAQFLGL